MISPWDQGQIGIKLGTKHVTYQKFATFLYEDIMLKGLKVSFLTCKCVFYRPKHNAKEEPQRNEFWRS